MSRDDFHIRDRLLLLAECSNAHKPFNVKRKSLLSKQHQPGSRSNSTKLSVQDFVRMDPGYTPDIEHLVFPARKRNPQQVAPINRAPTAPAAASKARSRLVEMFALSRHLQQRSADREQAKNRSSVINRSVDSVLEPASVAAGLRSSDTVRRWVSSAEEPVRQNCTGSNRLSPAADTDMTTTRGPNVSVLHLRSTSEPWETSPISAYPKTSIGTSSSSTRSYFNNSRQSSTGNPKVPQLKKHQSLGGTATSQSYKWSTSPNFRATGDMKSPEMLISKNSNSCNRELSPVRWCDREVDGVYLGRSGWVQVQQRSLDENRRSSYTATSSLQQSKRTGIKLADYHCNSEPGKCPAEGSETHQRPAYLSLESREFERWKSRTPSPHPNIIPESFSPPSSLTPIISPPPAFQDQNNKTLVKSRTFFGKTPFLPRSNAIEDSDPSPPPSPQTKWKTTAPLAVPPPLRKPKVPSPEPKSISRIPQTKSLEDTTATRRSQFVQRYGESSSSSSSSMGFRSLDSNFNRPTMPRLSENTDSSVDIYEDADDEDNNSSSINISIVSTINTAAPGNNRGKLSPSSRGNIRLPPAHHRTPPRRSPASSDTSKQPSNCPSPSSSSTDSNEFLSRSPPGQQQPIRRSAPSRPYVFNKSPQEDPSVQRVRRSRSLQLPERKTAHYPSISPPQQHMEAHRIINKTSNNNKRQQMGKPPQSLDGGLDQEMLREAEVVTGFLYGTRSRAAAQALLMHRYNNNNNVAKDEMKSGKDPGMKPATNGLTVYYVGGANKDRQRVLLRGSTSPSLGKQQSFPSNPSHDIKNPCNSDTCDFWPHCAHRESLNREAQFMMRSSQSYPTHQRSLDSTLTEQTRPTSTVLDRKLQDQYKQRLANHQKRNNNFPNRLSPNKSMMVMEKRGKLPSGGCLDPKSARRGNPVASGGSSSGSDACLLKGSSASSPMEDVIRPREMILTRPGSAPAEESIGNVLVAQQRSMSLPKSFLSAANYQQGGQTTAGRRRGTESLGSSPGLPRKSTTPEASHTAPVTPLHESGRRRSPLGGVTRRAKATSTPQLIDASNTENRKWNKNVELSNEFSLNPRGSKDLGSRRNSPGNTAESVLQKFRKTFSLRFQKKGSKENCISTDVGETLSEVQGDGEGFEEESPQHVPSTSSSIDEPTEQKYRFGPLPWRSSKEKKKLNKAARSAKCNSGDSGIQIEMVHGCGAAGDSSESHDTDPPGDELDSPPTVRKRPPHGKSSSRPHSDLLNQILIDKFKADLKQRAHKHHQVRRTHSDLGGQRLLHWDHRSSYRRLMSAPLRGRPQSPRKKPPDAPGGVQLRLNHHRRGQLRRSLSQPLDIDKLSPLMRTKTAGLRAGGHNVLSEDEHDARLGISDDEAMSDSESSVASLTDRKKSLELAMDEEMIILAEAVFDHVSFDSVELAFRAGDVIEVLETANRDWWWGSTKGKSGWFPAHFVRLRVSQEDTVEDCLAAMASGHSIPSQIRRRTSISLLSNDQVRTSVVRELVHTERDFVKVLQDVAEGYLYECRKRQDMFDEEQIATIFINLEEILRFQAGFLKDLEACIDWEAPYKSCVGACFLKHRAGFKMYSDYCNSHPMATATLQELYQMNNYSKFFEACRLMRGLIEIPLDGYLLTPVQRICKYPLQLAELLKYTKADHKDYEDITEALEAMRGVAMLINERKRRMESLEKLAAWQQRVEGWEGQDLIELSSQLIYQGEVARVTTGMWTNNITLFLFDHQIVYCKKDILKRNTYVYKGRIALDTCEIIDVADGKDIHLGVSVRHAIKLYSCIRDKWLLFCCRSSNDKQRWLRVFAEERKLVAQDKDDGLEFPAAARELARIAARRQRRPPRKPRNGKNYKHDSGYMGSSLQLNTTSQNSNSLGRKVGTWFTFGGNKKTRHQHHDVS